MVWLISSLLLATGEATATPDVAPTNAGDPTRRSMGTKTRKRNVSLRTPEDCADSDSPEAHCQRHAHTHQTACGVAVLDGNGTALERRRIDTGVLGFGQLMMMLTEHAQDATEAPVAIETDKNLIVVALQAAGLTVYAIDPRAVARYRERHGQSGKKSDPGDAFVLADILRHDRHQHRPLPSISEQARAVKALARQHQEAVWALHQTISRLRRCSWSSTRRRCRRCRRSRTSSTRRP